MILVKASAEILAINTLLLQLIEKAGRTCYKSEERITADSAAVFCKGLITRGHEAMLEHSMMTVKFVCDRGVSHELVRHRLASFAQESTRYCDYTRGHVTFVIPPWVGAYAGECKWAEMSHEDRYCLAQTCAERLWLDSASKAEQAYLSLRRMGWKPEQARSVLPNSLKTEVVMTANFREWRHFFKLRAAGTTGKPHPQMVELTVPLLAEVKKQVPVIFDDIEVKEEVK